MLMEATPEEIDPFEIERSLEKIEGVDFVHDLHVWSLSSGKHALIVHVRLIEGFQAPNDVLKRVDKLLRNKFKLNHLTI